MFFGSLLGDEAVSASSYSTYDFLKIKKVLNVRECVDCWWKMWFCEATLKATSQWDDDGCDFQAVRRDCLLSVSKEWQYRGFNESSSKKSSRNQGHDNY
jgi:hypothetical protein